MKIHDVIMTCFNNISIKYTYTYINVAKLHATRYKHLFLISPTNPPIVSKIDEGMPETET